MKLKSAIKNTKKKLIERVKKKGIYEDFGQKEISKLQDKFIDISKYTNEMNENRKLIEELNEWCMTYHGN